MKIKFLKAEHGDSILLSLKEKQYTRNILIDGGPASAFQERDLRTGRMNNKSLYNELESIKSEGQKIDLLILTHVDDDHINGIIKWFESSVFNTNMIGEVWFNSGKTIFEYFQKKEIKANRIKINNSKGTNTSISQGDTFETYIEELKIWNKKIIKAGDCYSKFGVQFKILSPSEDKLRKLLTKWRKESKKTFTGGSTKSNDYNLSIDELLVKDKFQSDYSKHNGSSIAFVLVYKLKNFIFLGDSHVKPVVDSIRNLKHDFNTPLKAEFLKVSHHGSKANTSNSLLRLIETDTYIISANGEHHHLPNKKCIARILSNNSKARVLFNYPILINKIFSIDEKKNYDLNHNWNNELNFD